MQVDKVIAELNKLYPGKNIFKNDDTNTTEILCEIEPTSQHSDYSGAVAVIDKSIPHYHSKLVEEYKVIKGELLLHIENQTINLKEKETYVIPNKKVHWAEGSEAWIECHSKPGWTFEDHIIAPQRNVAVVIFYDKAGNIGIQSRGNYSKAGEKYGLWGGAIEAGETPEQAMRRELLEELNLAPETLEYWTEFTYVVDIEGKYFNWVINHAVFLSPITSELQEAKVQEGESVKIINIDAALELEDSRFIIPLLKDLKLKMQF